MARSKASDNRANAKRRKRLKRKQIDAKAKLSRQHEKNRLTNEAQRQLTADQHLVAAGVWGDRTVLISFGPTWGALVLGANGVERIKAVMVEMEAQARSMLAFDPNAFDDVADPGKPTPAEMNWIWKAALERESIAIQTLVDGELGTDRDIIRTYGVGFSRFLIGGERVNAVVRPPSLPPVAEDDNPECDPEIPPPTVEEDWATQDAVALEGDSLWECSGCGLLKHPVQGRDGLCDDCHADSQESDNPVSDFSVIPTVESALGDASAKPGLVRAMGDVRGKSVLVTGFDRAGDYAEEVVDVPADGSPVRTEKVYCSDGLQNRTGVWMTAREAAEPLGISPASVRRRAKQNKLHSRPSKRPLEVWVEDQASDNQASGQ